jgi:endonuclease/exonuclease/phosphatase family metal-dependent hydrolase
MRPASILALATLCLLCLSASTCASPLGNGRNRSVSIVAYNVKSLFDSVDDGPEFAEFSVAKGKWDDARYKIRLSKVAEAVLAAPASEEGSSAKGPDILCLEEIENEGVLEALRSGPLAAAGYGYAAIAPAEGGPFSVCALSRLPILSVSCHSASTPEGRAGRDVLELEVDAHGRKLVVMACHWKSKSGSGAEGTEEARRADAALVRGRLNARLAADPAAEILVCGDFNESPDEYLRVKKRYATAFMPAEQAAAALPERLLVASSADDALPLGGEAVLFSPWEEGGGYSYSYRGNRERIDGFLLSPGLLDGSGLRYKSFSVVDADFLLDEEGAPIAWPGTGATGYSDHLPIFLSLEFVEEG